MRRYTKALDMLNFLTVLVRWRYYTRLKCLAIAAKCGSLMVQYGAQAAESFMNRLQLERVALSHRWLRYMRRLDILMS